MTPRRQHRFLTVPSGLLLFVCLFLPAVESCDKPVAPYEVHFYPPYLVGVFIAALAIVGPRARQVMTFLARLMMWITLGGAVVFLLTLMVKESTLWPVALIPIATAIVLSVVMGWEPSVEEMASARLVIATALLGIAWFGMWLVYEGDVLYGMYLSAGACVSLFVGGIEWRREVLRDRTTAEFPTAAIR